MKHELTFRYEKLTKNTIRFEEVPPSGQPPVVGVLYVQKWAIPATFEGETQSLKVTLEVV